MGDFGIKLSQPGKDVSRAGDKDLIFSSSWPNPKIVFNGRITTSIDDVGPDAPGIILKHNLGYVPFFIPYDYDSGFHIFRTFVSADETNIYMGVGGGGTGVLSVDVGLMVLAIDIEENYKAPSIDVGGSSATRGDKNIGLRLTKPHKDVSSNDLRDYLIHSRTRSPMIHEVSNGFPTQPGSTAVLKNYVYTHDLPYNPMFFAYIQGVGLPQMYDGSYGMVNGFSGVVTAGSTITVEDQNENGKVSIVVLKDPFVMDDATTEVVV